jgi:hypothetical protein
LRDELRFGIRKLVTCGASRLTGEAPVPTESLRIQLGRGKPRPYPVF